MRANSTRLACFAFFTLLTLLACGEPNHSGLDGTWEIDSEKTIKYFNDHVKLPGQSDNPSVRNGMIALWEKGATMTFQNGVLTGKSVTSKPSKDTPGTREFSESVKKTPYEVIHTAEYYVILKLKKDDGDLHMMFHRNKKNNEMWFYESDTWKSSNYGNWRHYYRKVK